MSEPICPLLEDFLAYRLINLIAECLREQELPDMLREQTERLKHGQTDNQGA